MTDIGTELNQELKNEAKDEANDKMVVIPDDGIGHSLWYYSWKRLKRNKLAMSGLWVLVMLVIVAIFAPFIAPFNPNDQILEFSTKPIGFKGDVLVKKELDQNGETQYIAIKGIISQTDNSITYTDYNNQQQTISKAELNPENPYKQLTFLLGTDRFGRDVLSRLIYGSRISLTVGLISESIAIILGLLFGSIAGFFRGPADKFIMWLINVVWAFPSILFVIAISVVLGKGFWQAFVAIGLTAWVDVARIVRGQIFSIRESEYIEATKAVGFKSPRIIIRHILPNCLGPVIITGTVGLATAIIFEASLSFLGLGVQPPTASWGNMIYDGYKYLIAGSNWGLAVFPSIAIMITVFSVNLFGDGIRDALDPKLKS
ncbi:MAG TPA: ABC transporter permease [Ignavibacteria bacterium]|nr:ABC transporter permease [Ignavibacteria bacterium]